MEIRMVETKDAKEILDIYAPYVQETTITFEYEVPTLAEFTKRIVQISKTMPYLVALEDGKIVGYGYASKYRQRKAYDWSVELSIYVDRQHKHLGIGTKIYDHLFFLLKELGYCRGYACITYPNPASEAFHSTYGFKKIGVFHKAGYKFDTWLDVLWMEYDLNPDNHNIHEPYSIKQYYQKKDK